MWFILNDGQVLGPFTIAEVRADLPKLKDVQIWGKGLSEWLPPDKWEKSLKKFPQATNNSENPEKWLLRIEGKELPGQTFQQLISHLKGLGDLSAVDVKLESDKNWQDVYSVNTIINELGISRRSHPRVPILADMACEAPRGNFKVKVFSISEGGLGVTTPERLTLGERFKGHLKSDNLYAPVSATMEVVFSGKEGYAGLKFVVISDEAKNSIIEYVKKFT